MYNILKNAIFSCRRPALSTFTKNLFSYWSCQNIYIKVFLNTRKDLLVFLSLNFRSCSTSASKMTFGLPPDFETSLNIMPSFYKQTTRVK